jgi:CreA protein
VAWAGKTRTRHGDPVRIETGRVIMLKIVLGFAIAAAGVASAEEVGQVTTAFKILGANHRIVVEAFDDPKVEGVACFVSRARTGGISGSLGLAEDTSDASINCQQTGPVKFREELEDGEEVFSRRASVMFKRIQVVRFFDETRNALVYLTYSDKLIDGSPKNSVSAVVVRDWQ